MTITSISAPKGEPVCISYIQAHENGSSSVTRLRSDDAPDPALYASLEALRGFVVSVLDLDGTDEESMIVSGVRHDAKKGYSISFTKLLSTQDDPFKARTPWIQFIEPPDRALLDEVEAQAVRYIEGYRAQGTLKLEAKMEAGG